MRAHRLTEPAPRAFAHVIEVYSEAADCLVLARGPSIRDYQNALWRWRAGKWEMLISLQSADQVEGPWTDVEGATSPYAVAIDKPAQFYRIRR